MTTAPSNPADQILEPAARLGVQVRLRLVEQQQVGLSGQARRQRDQLALAAAAHVGRPVDRRLVQAQLQQQRPPPALEGVAAGLLELLEQHRLAPQHPVHPVEVAGQRWIGETPPGLVQLLFDPLQVGTRRQHDLVRRALVRRHLLRQYRRDGAPAARDRAPVRLVLVVQQAQEGGLAAAVCADHADSGVLRDLEVEAVQDRTGAEGF